MADSTVTVVIATRNRVDYLERLLRSVLRQDFAEYECLVFDDGSTPDTIAAYEGLWRGLDARFHLHLRDADDRQPGGPSRIRNRGISLARGRYVAFCDDDDQWIRDDHLSVAVRALAAAGADLYFAAMQTAARGEVVDPDLYAPGRDRLQRRLLAGESDVYVVKPSAMSALLRHRTLHTDTIVATRALLFDAGLYWEKTSLAEDRDFSFRLIDTARAILFRSTVSAELEVSQHTSLYRSYAQQEKAQFAFLSTLHSELAVRNPQIRRLARAVRAWDLLELTSAALTDGRRRHAREFAVQSFLLHPNFGALRLFVASLVPRTS